ncbi:MAG TPA: hypothetical protein VKG24_09540 [Pseudolabrys sp.]|nr:hypothetical protein [Pseudolabrys sp.]
MANGDTRGERLQIMLSGDELILLDDFRYKTRMPSRSSAVRELLKLGLAAEGFGSAAFGTKSEEFGISGKMPTSRKSR